MKLGFDNITVCAYKGIVHEPWLESNYMAQVFAAENEEPDTSLFLDMFIESYPTPDSSVNKAIIEAADKKDVTVEFDSYSADSGIMSLVATGEDVEKINVFIASLMELDILEDVDYTGYTYNDADGTWSINVVCTLGEGEE